MKAIGIYIRDNWPLTSSFAVLCITILILLLISMDQNDGHLVYSFDDAYIHMALAKNFSQFGVWGVTKYEFTSCSSSLFWTTSLALVYFFAGPNETTPFIINLISAFLVIFAAYSIFKKEGIKPIIIFIALFFLIFLIQLPSLIFTGLEHVTHVFVSILFIYYASELISGIRDNPKYSIILVLLSLLLPVLRYEGLLSVLVVCALLLFKKKWLLSAFVFLAGTVPMFVFGLISVSEGWSFFPNSLIMKAGFPDVMSFNGFINFSYVLLSKLFTPLNAFLLIVVLVFLVLGFFVYKKYKNKITVVNKRDLIMGFLLIVNVVLYYIYSKTGWSYRYQSFLFAMAIFIVPVIFFKTFPRYFQVDKKLYITLVRVFGYAILVTGIIYQGRGSFNAIIEIPLSTTNIYEQQYQTAQFIKRFYQGKEVALNDIGTSSYFADIKLVDLWGLADIEVSKMRRTGIYLKNEIKNIARSRNLKIAVIYDSWFYEEGSSIIPEEWIKVGEWKISNVIACADDVVSVYAVDPSEKENLIKNLKLNSPNFPLTVKQSGIYTSKSY